MPRERGKLRQGSAWYSYAARQRLRQDLKRALSIARTQRTTRPHTPPMAYAKEEFTEEPIQVPPESLLYTVPDDYLRPRTNKDDTNTKVSMEGATCVVQEKFLEELLHTTPGAFIQGNTSEADAGAVADKDEATDTMREKFPISTPPLLNAISEYDSTPPNLFNLEQLELIFDLRSYMEDQLHHDTLINNQIDMLFDTFSNALTKQRCPTYVQPFMLQPNDDTLPGASDDRSHGAQNLTND